MSTPLEVFCYYVYEDQELLDQLIKHLAPLQHQGKIIIWRDTDINAGADLEKELNQHLDSADIILLLISADFLSSNYYNDAMKRAIQHHTEKSTQVIPILLRPASWRNTPLVKLKVAPTNAKPVTMWLNQDEAFDDIVKHIDQVITNRQSSLIAQPSYPIESVNTQKISGRLLIAIFLICAIIATILIINNISSLLLSILNGLMTVAGLFLAFQQAFSNQISLEKPTISRQINYWLAIILCLGLVISLSGNAFFVLHGKATTSSFKSTPIATNTPVPTSETIGSTPTALPILSFPNSLIINDPMSGPDQDDQWDNINKSYLSCSFVNGVYQLQAPVNQGGGCGTNTNKTILHNFIYELQMTIVAGINSQGSGVGLFFRYDAKQDIGYVLSFRQDGTYLLYYTTHQLSTIETLQVGKSQTFRQGVNQTNRIDIRVVNSTIDIFVNGTYLISTMDERIISGIIGVQMGAGTSAAKVNFSNLKIWVL